MNIYEEDLGKRRYLSRPLMTQRTGLCCASQLSKKRQLGLKYKKVKAAIRLKKTGEIFESKYGEKSHAEIWLRISDGPDYSELSAASTYEEGFTYEK